MSFSSFIFKKKPKELDLIIDVASYSVAAALVSIQKGKKAEIVLCKRTHLPLWKNWDEKKFISNLSQTLSKLLNLTLRQGARDLKLSEKSLRGRKIGKILCVVSSPWCLADTQTFSSESERPVKITSKEFDSVIKEGVAIEKDPYKEVERKIIQTRLNGYLTDQPINKRARQIEISVFEGKILKELLEKIKSVVDREIHGEMIFHSYVLSTFSAIEEIFPDSKDYLLIEASGETTGVSLIKNRLITETVSFPKGKNSFVRNICKELDVEPDIALSFLKLRNENKLEQNFLTRIENAIKPAREEWITSLKESLKNFKTIPPAEVFFACHPIFSDLLSNNLKLTMGHLTSKEIKVIFLGAQALNQFSEFKNDALDPFIATASIFLQRISN